MICDFDEITEYESKGYILVSYGKTSGGYRVNYSIPFSNKKALFHLSKFVLEELQKGTYEDFIGMGMTAISRGFTMNSETTSRAGN